MSQHRPVPRLDLAPKLRRPLTLWNPLDYLRLLYWVFFFPQALRWYVDTLGSGYISQGKMSWLKKWNWLRQNPFQRQFLLQGLALFVVTPQALGFFFQGIGIPVNWSGIISAMVLDAALYVWRGLAYALAFTIALGLQGDVLSGLVWNSVFSEVSSISAIKPQNAVYIANGTQSAVIFGAAFALAASVASGVVSGMRVSSTQQNTKKKSKGWSIISGLVMGTGVVAAGTE